MDDSDALAQVEFIPAFEDAKLRLDCFTAACARSDTFDEALINARALYAWCMESDPDAQTDESQLTESEDACTRKH